MHAMNGLFLLVNPAFAGDAPELYVREMVAVAEHPGGLISDTIVEARAPVLRYGGAVFNNTYVGGGARFAVSPAFAEEAVRVSLAPIDVFDVTFEGVRSNYFNNAFGTMPFDNIDDTTGQFRRDRFQDGDVFSGSAWTFIMAPTGKMKVGPVVGLSSWSLSWISIKQPEGNDDPWVFEPFRGLVVGWNDFIVEHTQAVLIQVEPKESLLRFGGVYRGKGSSVSPDGSISAGALLQFDPGGGDGLPSVTLVATPYIKDPDFANNLVPFVAGVFVWEAGIPFKQDLSDVPAPR